MKTADGTQEGRLVPREMWHCLQSLLVTPHPVMETTALSLPLETARFAFHLYRSLFSAIQRAYNVNNTNN